jgi:hypothetical protein
MDSYEEGWAISFEITREREREGERGRAREREGERGREWVSFASKTKTFFRVGRFCKVAYLFV